MAVTMRRRRAARRCAWILLALGIALRIATWALMTGFDWRRLLTEPSGDGRRPYLELLYQTFW